METSKTKNIVLMFLKWYFLVAPKMILQIWRNFLIFGWRFFSIRLLLRTLFAPWKRDVAKGEASSGLGGFFERLVINIFTRCLGAFVRLMVICLGLVFELIILLLGLLFFIIWLGFLSISIKGIIYGIILLSG